jgi:hypothetical protein
MMELNTMFLEDAVLSYGRLVRIFQADVAFMFLQSGIDGAASLPNVDFATLTWNPVNAWCPESIFLSAISQAGFSQHFEILLCLNNQNEVCV